MIQRVSAEEYERAHATKRARPCARQQVIGRALDVLGLKPGDTFRVMAHEHDPRNRGSCQDGCRIRAWGYGHGLRFRLTHVDKTLYGRVKDGPARPHSRGIDQAIARYQEEHRDEPT